MLAEKNEYLNEAVETVYQLSAEEQIREQCRAREEYYRIERTVKRQLENALQGKKEAEERLAETIAEKDATIAELEARIAQLQDQQL